MERFARFQAILDKLTYKDWEIRLGSFHSLPYLQVRFIAPDSETGDPAVQAGRKWFLDLDMEESAVVQTALLAVLTAEEHETREEFRYRGKAIFGPHFEASRLASLFASPAREISGAELAELDQLNGSLNSIEALDPWRDLI